MSSGVRPDQLLHPLCRDLGSGNHTLGRHCCGVRSDCRLFGGRGSMADVKLNTASGRFSLGDICALPPSRWRSQPAFCQLEPLLPSGFSDALGNVLEVGAWVLDAEGRQAYFRADAAFFGQRAAVRFQDHPSVAFPGTGRGFGCSLEPFGADVWSGVRANRMFLAYGWLCLPCRSLCHLSLSKTLGSVQYLYS